MTVTLYNTLTRKKEEFKPLCEGQAGMYTCGPTVYNYAHIGNLRSYIFADILRRTLRYGGYDVKQVMNVTDVGHLTSDGDGGDDKLDAQAKKSGESIWDIARYYEKIFFEDLDKLNIEQPAVKCRATEHIDDMIALVQKLWDKGYAYETAQAVYYDISKFPTYTQLSRQNLEDKLTAVRDEVNEDPEKKHSADFALWFKRVGRFANHIMHWDSPWGDGFPGWHAECSAMSMKYLGDTLDIHTGGEDHIWVHHPNEIAQSEGATGKKFVNYWLHGAFLVVDGASKMSKSSGNFLRVQTLIDEGYDPLAYRFMCFSAHYRAKLKFSWESLDSAASAYNNLKDFVARAKQLSDGEEGEWVKTYR
ncbi:MAG: cysteine--tRNA ligase, partial [Abditibacteriota bacterium]|nr:cysteine--tRNA ligase [Abditibacteriota bacterium]